MNAREKKSKTHILVSFTFTIYSPEHMNGMYFITGEIYWLLLSEQDTKSIKT